MTDYDILPAGASLPIQPFSARTSNEKLHHLQQLLELSPIAPVVFENTNAGRRYGLERGWLEHAKDVWLHEFDWRRHEDRLNSFPNFMASVEDTGGNKIDVHFLALFSKRADAVPIAMFHGWPGNVCEFLDILDILKSRYTAEDLPYHVIVPSLPGYGYSSGPPIDKDYGVEMAAEAMNKLMLGLGFGSGYIAHGGDLGSFVSRILAMNYDACKGVHVNMMGIPAPDSLNKSPDDEEKVALEKAAEAVDTGLAFLLEQGTRAATIGLALSSSPLALLSWIGEKFLEWSDEDTPLDKILESVTFYWLTDTFPRCLYHNRGMGRPDEKPSIARVSALMGGSQLKLPYVQKPTGYSLFAKEIVPVPKSWAVLSCNLVSYNQHDRGGHFAAMEKPKELLEDIEVYIKKAWNKAA